VKVKKEHFSLYLEPDMIEWLKNEADKDGEIKTSGIVRNLIRRAMKAKVPRKISTESSNDPFASSTINGRLIPDDLKEYSQLICEWWPIRHKKKATCSTKVAERIFNKLRTFAPKDRKIALEKAITGAWMDIWEVKQSKIAEEPKNNHPAHRVFTAKGGFID
tara:strand:- start:110 stop:595 length:486 start_codon:yes stop_codon:yes gene_type:complete